ncbi:MAG: hypothetical protein HKN59_06045 [Gammaproteobacteria bacterium]|nr:hypothetical protein [Gammaproteobacteria bacterium]
MLTPDTVTFGVTGLATVLAVLLAFRSCQRRKVQLGDEPTLPRYITSRARYWVGIGLYCLLAGGLFLLLVWQWVPVQPLISLLMTSVADGDLAGFFARLEGRTVLPLIFGGIYLLLLRLESRFNPLLLLRDALYDLFAQPRQVQEVYQVLRNSRLADIDAGIKSDIVGRLWVPSIDDGDFDKASDTVEYRWAYSCVLFDKIRSYADDSSFQRFFTEPSLKWGDICLSFQASSERVASWRNGAPHYTKTVRLIADLDKLGGLLARLLACIVVFGSASEEELWRTVNRLGGRVRRARLKHTYKYFLTFTAAVVGGVLIGREVAVLFHNVIFPDQTLRHFSFDTFRWVLYAVAIYIVPILIVFAGRVAADRFISPAEQRYYGFYTLAIVAGFLVSTSVSALILGLSREPEAFTFFSAFADSMRWGILPALMAGFVAYQMDAQVSDEEPKSRMFLGALARFFVWAVIAVVIALYATDELGPVDAQLRFTIVVTTLFVAGALAAVARFKTVYLGTADG